MLKDTIGLKTGEYDAKLCCLAEVNFTKISLFTTTSAMAQDESQAER